MQHFHDVRRKLELWEVDVMWFHAHVPALMARGQVSGWVAEMQSSSVAETQLEGESRSTKESTASAIVDVDE
jgi:hypothetical protein